MLWFKHTTTLFLLASSTLGGTGQKAWGGRIMWRLEGGLPCLVFERCGSGESMFAICKTDSQILTGHCHCRGQKEERTTSLWKCLHTRHSIPGHHVFLNVLLQCNRDLADSSLQYLFPHTLCLTIASATCVAVWVTAAPFSRTKF